MNRRTLLRGLAAAPLSLTFPDARRARADAPGLGGYVYTSPLAHLVRPDPAPEPGWYDDDPPPVWAELKLNLEFAGRLNRLRTTGDPGPDVAADARRVARAAWSRPLPAVEPDYPEAVLARWIVEDNARTLANTREAISHKDSAGRWPDDRRRLLPLAAARAWGSEVLSAGGDGSLFDPLEGWILSPGHRAVLLDPRARRVGLWLNVQREPRSPYRWFDGALRRWGCVVTS